MTGETDRFDEPQAAETPARVRTPSDPLITAKLYGDEAHMCADAPEGRETRWRSEASLNGEHHHHHHHHHHHEAKDHPTTEEHQHQQHYQRNTRNTAHRHTFHSHPHSPHHHNKLSNQLTVPQIPRNNSYNTDYQYSGPYDFKNTSHCEFQKFINNNNSDDLDLNSLRPPSPGLRHKRTRSASLPFLTLADLKPLNRQKPFRVIVMGDAGVGKSSLVMQYVSSLFGDYNDYESVLSENPDEIFEKTVQIDGQETTLQIVDTPPYGQPEFEDREDEFLAGGDAYLLVYSITSRRSFKKANEMRFKLQRTQETEMVPIILVGNKTDLERSREVPFAEGKHFAALFDCKLIETSASLSHNIEEMFDGVIRQIRLRRERRLSDEMETASGGSLDSGKGSPTRERTRSPGKKCSRRQSMLKRARGAIGRLLRRKSGDEPTPGYRARSKSCHVMEVL